LTAARRLARALYSRASGNQALRGPLDAIRTHPRVRAFARRHLDVLLARGTTWANVDGALRLLAEDPSGRIVFGPWQGDVATELLYWAPFVRWAQEHFALDPARIAVVSTSGAGHWYGDACGAYADTIEAFPGAGLPARILGRRAEHLHRMRCLARGEDLAIDVAGVHQMLRRQQALVRQGGVDRGEHLDILHRGRGRGDMGDQIRRLWIAGLRHVYFEAGPDGAALLAVARFHVIGRVD